MQIFLNNLGLVLKNYPDCDLVDSFSKGQLESKFWLIEELEKIEKHLGTVFVLGGWYGTLAALMFESNKFEIKKIRNFDLDDSCADIADTMNCEPFVVDEWKFKASTADMYELDYYMTTYTTRRRNKTEVTLTDFADTIINTSCEHLAFYDNWYKKLPIGKLTVLQSNNFLSGNGHVNCVSSIEEFKSQSPMAKYFYEGELHIPKANYTRFMLIGEK